MKKLIVSLIVLFSTIGAKAEIQFSDSLRISLLTVEDGKDAYECFGHTGILIEDLKGPMDVVFHYGVYNYTEPNFIWHFIEGKCNYMMGGCEARTFFYQHVMRNLNVTQQVLSLDSAQCQALTEALLVNYRPENRNYRYNFFFDNCATRPFDMITKWCDIQYDTTWVKDITLRDMIQEKTGTGNWLDFGIALAVAGRADQQASFKEQMFLPSYLKTAFDHATNHGSSLVVDTILHTYPDQEKEMEQASPLSPMVVGMVILLLSVLITVGEALKKGGKATLLAGRIFDSTWLFATGVAGLIIWYLNFFSLHPAVDNNLNCWWLLPTNLLFIAFIWLKKAEKVRRIYFFIIFAAEIIYIISVCTSAQYVHPAFVPMLIAIALRCIAKW